MENCYIKQLPNENNGYEKVTNKIIAQKITFAGFKAFWLSHSYVTWFTLSIA